MRDDGAALMLAMTCALALGCGGAAREPARDARAGRDSGARSTASPALDARSLGANATFADLVRLARSLSSGPQADSSAGCVLERVPEGGYALAADLMLALERMPDPPTDLGALFERDARPIALLSAFGSVRAEGEESSLALATFTSTAPSSARSTAVVLALDHDRAFVRTSAAAVPEARSEPISSAVARALAQREASSGALYVSASASTPLSDLAAALELIPAATPIALAVLLPPGTALPKTRSELEEDVTCPNGLPDVAHDAALGDLDARALAPALEALQPSLAPCLSAMAIENARVVLALRVAADGSIAHGCLLEAAGLDARTASCVVLAARGLMLPAPSPAGVVDLHLPLALHAEGPAAQRALCAR